MKDSNNFFLGRIKIFSNFKTKMHSPSLSKMKTTLQSISPLLLNQACDSKDKECKTTKKLNDTLSKGMRSSPEEFFLITKNKLMSKEDNKSSSSILRDSTSSAVDSNNEFEYRQIFRQPLKEKEKSCDNRLNIIYAQDEKDLLLRNKNKYQINDLINSYSIRTGYLNNKLNEINDKILFMKGVINHAFPSIMIKKIKVKSKEFISPSKMQNDHRFISPCDMKYKTLWKRKNEQSNYLRQSIHVLNKSCSLPSISVK